jgi:predicted dehydrogenase
MEHGMASGTAEKRVLNVGVIGCGGIARNHVFSLSLIENNARKIWTDPVGGAKIKVKLYALADIDDAALDGFASTFGVQKLFRGPRCGYDLIDDPDVHVIYVLVPTVDHLGYVLAAANNGKHVFCEKPTAFSPADVQQMIDARDANNVVIQVGLVMRSAPQIHYLRKLLGDNAESWGQPTNIIFRDSQQKPYLGSIEVHNSTWRGFQEKAHAGILFEHTIHDLDAMIMVFGEVEEVYAKVAYRDRPGIETSVAAVLTFKNGINLSVNSIWNDIDYSQRRMEIFFENAWIHVTVDERAGGEGNPDKKLAVIQIKHGNEPEQEMDDVVMDAWFREQIGFPDLHPEIPGPYYYEDVRFIDAIVHGTPSAVTLEHGKYVQTVIEACYASAREARAIKIDDFVPQ